MRGPALAVIAVTLGAGGTAVASTHPPALRIVDNAPLSVRGTHFAPRERVTVTAISDGKFVKHVRASRTGAFTTTFPDVVFGKCGGASLRAVGALGSRAVARVQLRACMPVASP